MAMIYSEYKTQLLAVEKHTAKGPDTLQKRKLSGKMIAGEHIFSQQNHHGGDIKNNNGNCINSIKDGMFIEQCKVSPPELGNLILPLGTK